MKIDNLKIAASVLVILGIVWFVVARPKPLEKYRESKEVGNVLIAIDVCGEKGADTKKTSRINGCVESTLACGSIFLI